MANIALKTASRVEVVESIIQLTSVAAEAIVAGAPVKLETTTGKFLNALGTTAPNARVIGIATKTVAAGEALTAIRRGVLDGYDFTSQAWDAPIYLSDTSGTLGDTAGTVSTVVGRVIPAWGQLIASAADKLLAVDL